MMPIRCGHKSLAMQPSKLTEFINAKFEQAARENEAPVLVTSPGIRAIRGAKRMRKKSDHCPPRTR
jgi:hypothetical protein